MQPEKRVATAVQTEATTLTNNSESEVPPAHTHTHMNRNTSMCGAHAHVLMHTNAPLGWQVEEPPTKQPRIVEKARPPWRRTAEPSSSAVVDIYTWGKRLVPTLHEQEMDKICKCHVELDLTHIWDPGAAQGPLRHCSGFNATICLRLLLMPEFRDRIFECKSVIMHAVKTGTPLRLGILCNGGRHRSVALAEMLQHFLSGLVRVTTTHITYRNPCGCPNVCRNFGDGRADPREADAHAAHAMFARIWHHEW